MLMVNLEIGLYVYVEKWKPTSIINIVWSPLVLILGGGRNHKYENKPLENHTFQKKN